MKDVKTFLQCKTYLLGLALITACAYGYAITHYAIGMDDTAIPLYFEEGLAPYVGRWSLFVLNKIFPIADFVPWMTELISVLILMLSVTLWCVVWRRICEPCVKIPLPGYVFVAGIFLSCPIISEVFVFYLHNGICLGYGVSALALLCLLNSLRAETTGKKELIQAAGAGILLAVAMGFYESFMIVYIMGAVMCFFLIRRLYEKGKILLWLGHGILSVGISLLVRMVILTVLKTWYGWEELEPLNVSYRSLFGDIFTVEGELVMTLKRFFMKYYVHGIVYLPITILVIALLFVGVYSLYYGIRKKDILLPVCTVGFVLLPIGMSLVEGLATRYRSAQYVPLMGAFAVLLILIELSQHNLPVWVSRIGVACICIVLFCQCTDMNKWFYLDELKYENTKTVMNQIAYDLKKDYDISKPIVFRGAYTVPYEISKDAYVSFSSKQYQWICRLTDWVDPHLKEKFYGVNGKGYVFGEMPTVSTLQWGVTAFDGTAQQLIEFWKMHGYEDFRCETDLKVIEEAEKVRVEENMPGYPHAGYIQEFEDYIIVNF